MFIKKIFNVILSFFVFFFIISPARVEAKETIVVKENQISLVEKNEDFYTYYVSEFSENYYLTFYLNDQVVKVNNVYYTLNDFLKAASEQNKDSNSYPITYYLSGLQDIDFVERQNSYIDLFTEIPTSGYGVERYVGDIKKFNFELGLTAAILTVVASFIFGGNVAITKEFVTAVLLKAIEAGLINSLSDYLVNGTLYYEKYQAQHKTLPATKERRVPYYKTGSYLLYDEDSEYTTYFWYAQPPF